MAKSGIILFPSFMTEWQRATKHTPETSAVPKAIKLAEGERRMTKSRLFPILHGGNVVKE